jgi:hypothetical protein
MSWTEHLTELEIVIDGSWYGRFLIIAVQIYEFCVEYLNRK